ncbi:MAG: general stress protein [Chthoniobacterales bacterium]
MSKSVIGIVTSRQQTEQTVQNLQAAGFPVSDISILIPDTDGERDFGHIKASKAPEGATTGAATGGVVGGVLGLLAGIGALAIPGVGPLIAAGPIMAALSGLGAGALAGGLVGGLVGLGIPEIEAKRYEEKLKSGNYFIAVHTDDGDQITLAKEVLKNSGAEDISTVGEASAPKP